MVCPFFIFCPTSTNFFPPGSGARYAVPTIGEVIFVPSLSIISCFFFTSLGATEETFIDRDTFTFVVPSPYSISLRPNSFKYPLSSSIIFLFNFHFIYQKFFSWNLKP